MYCKTLILLFLLCSTANAQFVPMSKMFKNGEHRPGRHLVLVSADWCEPCKAMKQELLAYQVEVKVVDYDKSRPEALKFLKGRRIPQLMRYDVDATGKVVASKYYERNEPLASFIGTPKSQASLDKLDMIISNQMQLFNELREIKKLLEKLTQ